MSETDFTSRRGFLRRSSASSLARPSRPTSRSPKRPRRGQRRNQNRPGHRLRRSRLWRMADCFAADKNRLKLVAVADAFADRAEGSLKSLREARGRRMPSRLRRLRRLPEGPPVRHRPGEAPTPCLPHSHQAGKHVFMEKPVARRPRRPHRCTAANKRRSRKSLKVGVGLQRHHNPIYRRPSSASTTAPSATLTVPAGLLERRRHLDPPPHARP